MAGEYPKRNGHFAHKAFRLMHKTSLAAEIGRDAFCIIAVVLHTEDAARYRGPVTFWNSQLMETLGFAKWDSFDRARGKAVESGWLQYSSSGKRFPGKYYVTIPDGFQAITDLPIEDDTIPDSGYKDGYNAGYKAGIIEGIKRVQTGVQSGDKQGYSSTLDPNPNPTPTPTRQKADVSIPADVDPQTWADWLAVRKAKRAGPVTKTAMKLLANAAKASGLTIQQAIEHAAGSGWITFKSEYLCSNDAGRVNGKPRQQRVLTAEECRTGVYNPQNGTVTLPNGEVIGG